MIHPREIAVVCDRCGESAWLSDVDQCEECGRQYCPDCSDGTCECADYGDDDHDYTENKEQ